MIEIPPNIDKYDYLLALTHTMLDRHDANFSEELLGEYKTEKNINQEFDDMMNVDTKIRIPAELYQVILQISNDEVTTYIDKHKRDTKEYDNNFTQIIEENQDIFNKFLDDEKGQTSYNKTNCKELLVESIRIYKTKYNDEMYIKTNDYKYKHVGNSYERIYQYFKERYEYTPNDLQRFIPFSSFFSPNKIKSRTFESLEPNRHIILFNDCILDVSQAKTRPQNKITDDNIPFSVIDGNYKDKNEKCNEFITNLLKKLVKEPNILRAILYSLINKDELIKSAIFNIQPSGKGKSTLLEPFKRIGILITAKSKTLEKYLELETLFKQKLIVNFEEIQDAKIQGSDFNSLIDDSAITVSRKNQKAIDVPAYIKPAIIINGEDLPDFKGRTRGTLNRFSLMPKFIDEITEEEAGFIKENGFLIGIEMIRHLMLFKLNTTKKQRKEWLKSCKITEKQYLELRESKSKIIFEYIMETPADLPQYCISEKILEEMVIHLQNENKITVNLFNKESTIRKFIKNEIIQELNLANGWNDGYMNQSKRQGVKKANNRKTHLLKNCLQPTKKGLELLDAMNYDVEDLKPKSNTKEQ